MGWTNQERLAQHQDKSGHNNPLFNVWERKKLRFFLESVASGEFCAEFFDASGGVNVFEPARVERMTNVTNIDFQFGTRALGDERISATAGHFRFDVFRVNAFFHGSNFPSILYLQQYSTFENYTFYHKNAQKQVGGWSGELQSRFFGKHNRIFRIASCSFFRVFPTIFIM